MSAQVWAASPHQFGPGKKHVLDDKDAERTMCGKVLSAVPGKLTSDENADCKVCITALANRARDVQRSKEYEARRIEHEQQRATETAEWQAAYHAHLRSGKWANTRQKVLERASGICEGCGETRATQVHHLTYKNVGHEFLWELVAICRACHERRHGHD